MPLFPCYVIAAAVEPIPLELHLTNLGMAFLRSVSLALFYEFGAVVHYQVKE